MCMMYMSVHTRMMAVCVLVPEGARRGCWTSQPGVTEGSQWPHGCWELGLLQEQQVLLTDEPTTDETRGEFLNNITYQS